MRVTWTDIHSFPSSAAVKIQVLSSNAADKCYILPLFPGLSSSSVTERSVDGVKATYTPPLH